MYLVIENSQKSYSFPTSKTLLIGNDADCDIQINHPEIRGRHFDISAKSYGCVLKIYNDYVLLNGHKVAEKCMLDTGDVLQVGDLSFRLLDDQYIPRDSSINHTNINLKSPANTSSVYGIRSFAVEFNGRFIIDNFHHPDGWHVFRKDNELHFVDNQHKTFLNGLQIAQAHLSNGDIIANAHYKYKIELPGSSGFSKFSPSHPRNIQLSESVGRASSKPQVDESGSDRNFLKNNLWWLTLLVGLIVLLLIVINNPAS